MILRNVSMLIVGASLLCSAEAFAGGKKAPEADNQPKKTQTAKPPVQVKKSENPAPKKIGVPPVKAAPKALGKPAAQAPAKKVANPKIEDKVVVKKPAAVKNASPKPPVEKTFAFRGRDLPVEMQDFHKLTSIEGDFFDLDNVYTKTIQGLRYDLEDIRDMKAAAWTADGKKYFTRMESVFLQYLKKRGIKL